METPTTADEALLFDEEVSKPNVSSVQTEVPDEALTTAEEIERIRQEWQTEKEQGVLFPYRVPEDNMDHGMQSTSSFVHPRQKHRIAIGVSVGLLVLAYFTFTGIIALVRNWPF